MSSTMSTPERAETPSDNHGNDGKPESKEKPQISAMRYNFSRVIIVYVGPKKVPFIVHADVICEKSEFFKAACSERWVEGQTKTVNLPEECPGTFHWYVEWIYTSTFTTPSDSDSANANHFMFMKLYILGDVIDDYQLRNAAMEHLLDNMRQGPGMPVVGVMQHLYDLTPAGSPLRRMIVYWVLSRADWQTMASTIGLYPKEFVQELAMAGVAFSQNLTNAQTAERIKGWYKPETGAQ